MTFNVGVIQDDRYLEHQPGHTHPEHPSRLRAVYRMLKADFPDGLIPIHPEPATLENLELVHTPAYIQKVLKTAEHHFTSLAPDTPTSEKSYLASWLAVGGCLNGLEALFSGQCHACVSLIRPPGHHALADRAGGFCIFNNIAIMARHALKFHNLKRILIIDWDVHHGNGIQDIFHGDPRVLYFSTHDKLLYPYTGDWEEAGEREGAGYTINIPLPRQFADSDFLFLYRGVLTRVFCNFSPQLILVSAGFDAHRDDPIGRSSLTEKAFGRLTRLILDLCKEIHGPPVLFALEGGYDPRALADSVREVFRVLTVRDAEQNPPEEDSQPGEELLEKALKIHLPYGVWANEVNL